MRAVAFLLAAAIVYSLSSTQIAVLVSRAMERVSGSAQGGILDPPDQTVEADFDTCLKKVEQAISQGDYDEALTCISRCEALAGEDNKAQLFELYIQQASIHIVRQAYDQALPPLQKALSIDPGSTQALLLRAQTALGRGDSASAVTDLKTCLELEPENVSLWTSLAQVYEGMERYTDAGACYQTVCTLLPEEDIYRLSDLRCRLLSGDTEGALSGLDQYIDEHAAAPEAKAIEVDALAEAAEQAEDMLGTAYFLRGCCQMQRYDFGAAIADLESAIAGGYDEAAALEQLLACAYVLGRYEDAIAYGQRLEGLEDADFNRGSVYQQMGLCAVALERYEEAVRCFGKSILFGPELTGNHYHRGMSLLAMGRYDEAIQDFTDSIADGYLDQFCYYNRGVCYVQLQDYESALADMEQVIDIGDDPSILEAAEDVRNQLEAYLEEQETGPTNDDTQP